jgi:hypothetical protein
LRLPGVSLPFLYSLLMSKSCDFIIVWFYQE